MRTLALLALLCSCSSPYYARVDADAPVTAVFDGNVLALRAQGEVTASIIAKSDQDEVYSVTAEEPKLIVARIKPRESETIEEGEDIPAWAAEMVMLLGPDD